jgi:hypothetical protein
MSRNLNVLRINDRVPSRKGHIDDSPANLVGTPPPGLNLVTFADKNGNLLLGISDWETAIAFWQTYQPDQRIDIIAADVRFDTDRTSPLHVGEGPKDIPTGLSHLKPFAAMSRAFASPLGIGIHTADPGLWERLARATEAGSQAMGLLAAHEGGEVAAIMGGANEILDLSDEERLRWCWNWFHTHTVNNFADACRLGVQGFRKSMVRAVSKNPALPPPVFVLPSEWIRLAAWCREMQVDPKPIGTEGPSVNFILRDGRGDSINLRSLFSDVQTVNIVEKPLPASCFKFQEARKSCIPSHDGELDSSRLPRIGAFVEALGTIHDVVSLAWDAIREFPLRLPPISEKEHTKGESSLVQNLRQVLGGNGNGQLARGLAVVFQILRRDYANQLEWENAVKIGGSEWNPRKKRFSPNNPHGHFLAARLAELARMAAAEPGLFVLADILEDRKWCGEHIKKPGAKWVVWHARQLVAAGTWNEDEVAGMYWAIDPKLRSPWKMPNPLPPGLPWIGPELNTFLIQSLGYSEEYGPAQKNDFNGLTRSVRLGFGLQSNKAAQGFVRSFVEGNGPEWLKALCRDVVIARLGWINEGTWPRSIAR